jgi:uncharacterized protein (TIGR03663 family)
MRLLRPAAIFLVPVLFGGMLRFPDIGRRPMHCDEAVHADKFGTLLEGRGYVYDPTEYHGPTLYYLTLIPAWLQGARTYQSIDERTMRWVPAVFGVLLIAAHLLLIPFVGTGAALVAAALTAISPAMVFYSRYYIHEVLLVFFSFGALLAVCHYLRKPGIGPALAAGACAGLMHATKETTPIVLGSMGAGVLITLLIERRSGGGSGPVLPAGWRRDLGLACVAAAVVSILLFSSFFTNSRGVLDSLRAYGLYLGRVSVNTWHHHPWDYYLRLLIHFPAKGTPFWTEGLILVLAGIGAVAGWTKRGVPGVEPRIVRFLGIQTLLMVGMYAAIPYKTPWCALGFLHGMILLAGAGAVFSVTALPRLWMKPVMILALAAASAQLGWQARASSFLFAADPRNPYVYAHTGEDVFRIAGRIEALARVHSLGLSMPVDIISRENLWPMPWYLRRLTAVRWWNGVSETTPSAPVILASPEMEPDVVRKIYELPPPGERELYMNIYDGYVELRPRVELRGYAAMSLWDSFRRHEAEAETSSPAGPSR